MNTLNDIPHKGPAWEFLALVGWIVAILAIVMFINAIKIHKRMQQRLDYYGNMIQTKSGGGELTEPRGYYLVSIDGGETWWNAESAKIGWHLKSQADPELLKRITAVDDLTAFVEKNGTINPNDKTGIVLLERAGLTVKVLTNQVPK